MNVTEQTHKNHIKSNIFLLCMTRPKYWTKYYTVSTSEEPAD